MRLLKNIMQIIKMPLEASPVITVEVFMLKLIQGVMPVIKLFIMAHLLDNLLSFISAEENAADIRITAVIAAPLLSGVFAPLLKNSDMCENTFCEVSEPTQP